MAQVLIYFVSWQVSKLAVDGNIKVSHGKVTQRCKNAIGKREILVTEIRAMDLKKNCLVYGNELINYSTRSLRVNAA